jgi:hypothetical protein
LDMGLDNSLFRNDIFSANIEPNTVLLTSIVDF